MQITISLDGPEPGERSGPVTVGWMLTQTTASVLFKPPTRLRSASMSGTHVKSVARCPAVLNYESRFFEIACPYDLRLGLRRTDAGKIEIVNLMGDQTPVRQNKLAQIINTVAENEWRSPDRPIFQLKLPYLFLADEPVYLNQGPAFEYFRPDPLPGLMIGGRFPIHIWPRPLMWAFEWHNLEAPVTLRRGQPLFYAQFETLPQDRPVRLVEAEQTPELKTYLDEISGVVNYVNQTFSLFEAAEARRPQTLVSPVKR
ncbi:hypothetical protein [Mameliella sediminis]|uniref:hypothetical protein n=1 Tax=Mameliella sediminis TaxID=2836866 RepID=UPI001C48BE96|nr:hypothetical protein [Mameliella sediminis]MBY6117295.1 hypothetical protein [Antarctobacter heliothermus]MBY6147161.1 hypothetical protein [Mameliella alba]MBV7397358.1 hypothetical protein [Mameliella sediminis]MBY6172528.1 hypothetical protein [Mameliella alba]MCA0957202.1 hypothetical protein [Mameliella alba]